MATVNARIAFPASGGTPVFRINGKKELIGLSADWNTRTRPQGRRAGCPSWIESIVVAQSFDAASKAKKLKQTPGIASSSFSSRDVSVIHVDTNGQTTTEESVPFLFIPKFHLSTQEPGYEGIEVPVADEIWFSSVSFQSALKQVNDSGTTDVDQACDEKNVAPNV